MTTPVSTRIAAGLTWTVTEYEPDDNGRRSRIERSEPFIAYATRNIPLKDSFGQRTSRQTGHFEGCRLYLTVSRVLESDYEGAADQPGATSVTGFDQNANTVHFASVEEAAEWTRSARDAGNLVPAASDPEFAGIRERYQQHMAR